MKNHTQIIERKDSKRASRTQSKPKIKADELLRRTQTGLEDAIDEAASLLETVTALFEAHVSEPNGLVLNVDTIYGLRKLADRERSNLIDRFDSFLVAHRTTA
jgi:hypothetical protein